MARSQALLNNQLLDLRDDALLQIVHRILGKSHQFESLHLLLFEFAQLHLLQLQVVVYDNFAPPIAEQVARVPDVRLLDLALAVRTSGLSV